MKPILTYLIGILLTCQVASAQNIYFCSSYSDYGDPVGANTAWSMNPEGGNLYVLYKNGGRPFNVSSITFYIDKLSSSGSYIAWDNKVLYVSPDRTWAVLDYKFSSVGDYKISVLINSIYVSTAYVNIQMKNTNVPSNTLYYSGSSITPGTSVDASTGYVYGAFGPFYRNTYNEAKVAVKVSNGDKTLGTNKLYVDVYKMNTGGTYDKYDTKTYNITNLNWVFFNYTFYNAGTYKFSVFNDLNVWINSVTTTVY